MKDLKGLIDKHTNEGVVDYKSIQDAINQEINDVVAKNKPNQDKLIAESKDKWIEEFGFEGVKNEAQLKAYVKGTSDEWKEQYNSLDKEYKSFKETHADYEDLKKQMSTYKQYEALRAKGVTDTDTLEFLAFKINKAEGETFEDKLTAYEVTNPNTFQETKVTTGAKIGAKVSTETLGFEEILNEKYDLK
jgi:vacuolar-type H+-ATPase subunit I/STV1